MEYKYKVIVDTRSPITPDVCPDCKTTMNITTSYATCSYECFIYQCPGCGGKRSLMLEREVITEAEPAKSESEDFADELMFHTYPSAYAREFPGLIDPTKDFEKAFEDMNDEQVEALARIGYRTITNDI